MLLIPKFRQICCLSLIEENKQAGLFLFIIFILLVYSVYRIHRLVFRADPKKQTSEGDCHKFLKGLKMFRTLQESKKNNTTHLRANVFNYSIAFELELYA